MENAPKNFYEDPMFLLDHVHDKRPTFLSQELYLNDNTRFLPNVYNTNNDTPSENQMIGNPGLQLAELGVINIPFYIENNNVYSRDNLTNRNFYDQSHNNMLFHNMEIPNFETSRFYHPVNPNVQYDHNDLIPRNDISQISSVNEIYNNNNNIGFSPHMVLESPFPSPNLITMNTLPVSVPIISFDQQNFNHPFNPKRSHTFSPYDAECQSQVTRSANSLCTQKPPVYTKWTEEEDELLRAAISIYGPHKWSLIAAHVPNRTPMQCSTRWLGALNPTIHKGRWTPEEDTALKDAVNEYVNLLDSDGHPQPIPWNKIASRIPHRTGIQCQARWSEALDPSVRKGKWSPEEDDVLKDGVKRYGRCWIRIAELIEGRTQRQCRTRWVQIKNKMAKIERDSMASKNASETIVSTDEESNEMLTPPQSASSTPTQTAQTVIGRIPSISPPVILLRPMNRITTVPSQTSPITSPTETSATESCVTTPENVERNISPSFKSTRYLFHNPYMT